MKKSRSNAIRILWGTPFATEYEVQYGDTDDISDISQNPPGLWHSFVKGIVKTNDGGERTTRLSQTPVRSRYLRILLKKSSYSAPVGSADIRDSLGYAIREVYVGNSTRSSAFHDLISHGLSAKSQTNIIVSSTDPWHRNTDKDRKTEHIGFDRIFSNGLTNGLPMLVPVSVLFGTPDDAAAEIGYLTRKGYSIGGVEIGEEPDGQYVTPEDYGALYIQWAESIHRVAPNVPLGGPSFQEVQPDERPARRCIR